jgi:hypothetical protein
MSEIIEISLALEHNNSELFNLKNYIPGEPSAGSCSLATLEILNRRISVQNKPRKIVCENLS